MNHKHFLGLAVIAVAIAGLSFWAFRVYAEQVARQEKRNILLSVPAITQAPGGNWANPWGNACEEASATMIAAFYEGKKTLPQATANKTMQVMFAWQNNYFGQNEDTGADHTKQFIEATTDIDVSIVRNPSLEDIKDELRAGRPVIALVNQFELYNEKPSRVPHATFHVFVIVGFDDATRQFTVNDPARSGKKYSYDRLMGSLHDLGETGEADGEPTVLFTRAGADS